jgi:hypothetical protein
MLNEGRPIAGRGREAMIERHLGKLRDRKKRLSAREASLEAKLNQYFLRHSSQYRRLLDRSDF